MTHAEVAVVGLGPAGRALAHRLLVRGARVLVVDPQPGAHWSATYGGWAHQLPDWLSTDVVGAHSTRTLLTARSSHVLPDHYAVLDNAKLQRELSLDGAEVRATAVGDGELADLAPVVVDCRGARRHLRRHPRPLQTAHGVLLPREVGERVLAGAEAILMDWRPSNGAATWQARRPSFLYVIPLPDGRVLAEETCLAGDPPLGRDELVTRLGERLAHRGLHPHEWRHCDTETVRIPMLAPPASVTNRFGAAGHELNPITGYSVFASLARADEAAAELLRTGGLGAGSGPWRPLALGALLNLRPDAVVELFDAFGRLPATAQRAVFDPHAATPRLLGALARQWALMPWRDRPRLVGATIRALAGQRS